jgi:hypothetical protein
MSSFFILLNLLPKGEKRKKGLREMLNAENPFKGFFISKETFSFISLSISLRNFYITKFII